MYLYKYFISQPFLPAKAGAVRAAHSRSAEYYSAWWNPLQETPVLCTCSSVLFGNLSCLQKRVLWEQPTLGVQGITASGIFTAVKLIMVD